MDNVKVSVCISVYNTEKYLMRCLDSLVRQTLKEIEIVVVNDGSTDGSLEILNEYKKKYSNVVVISQPNKGLSVGRMVGVEHAHGDYIAFLDADDYVKIDTYEKLYNYAIEHEVDIVEMNTQWGNRSITSTERGILDAHIYLHRYLWGNPVIWPMLWLRIYRRDLFKHGVFTELYCNNEDIFAFPCLLYNAKQIGFLNEQLHVYSVDYEDSIQRGLPKNRCLSIKYYDNRKTTLESVNHIRNYLHIDDNSEFLKDFYQHEQLRIVTFLHTDISGISYKKKYADICNILNFKNKKEIKKFVYKNAINHSLYSRAVRIFGIRLSKHLRKLKDLFVKG